MGAFCTPTDPMSTACPVTTCRFFVPRMFGFFLRARLVALWLCVPLFCVPLCGPLLAADPPGAVRGLLPRGDVPSPDDAAPMIVILGGTNAHAMQRHGYLETLLAAASPTAVPRMRNLAWQADTVYRQQRPRNFFLGGLAPPNEDPDHRGRIAADWIVFWMGQNEALGSRSPQDFSKAYADLLEQLRPYAHRLVLVTPVPFEDPLKLGIDLQKRNDRLAQNADAIRDVAKEKHLELIDLHAVATAQKSAVPRTRDGSHLTANGQWWAAVQLAQGLQKNKPVAEVAEPTWPDVQLSEDAERLRQEILEKNQLWMRYWRPTNWAFLYGNRQFVESSRDHRNFKSRWFPAAVESIASPIDEAEVEIQSAAKQVNP